MGESGDAAVSRRTAPLIAQRVREVRTQVAGAARRSGRDPQAVRIVAVTKSANTSVLLPLEDAGILDFAENRWQDAREKLLFAERHLDKPPVWHFIGRLQSNKVKYVVSRFAWIHSVDSRTLAQDISAKAEAHGLRVNTLVQVNVSGEASKAGLHPDEVAALLRATAKLPGIEWRGLMTMAPNATDMEEVRPVFAQLQDLLHDLQNSLGWASLQELSMGMSNDFPVAVEEGATMVRVGRRLVGEQLRSI